MKTTKITVTAEALVVEPLGWNKLWSFTRYLRIPIDHVEGATFCPASKLKPKAWRAPGLHLPGRSQGIFRSGRDRQFWNTVGHDRTVVVTLATGAPYDRLVVSVDDPRRVVESINAAVEAG